MHASSLDIGGIDLNQDLQRQVSESGRTFAIANVQQDALDVLTNAGTLSHLVADDNDVADTDQRSSTVNLWRRRWSDVQESPIQVDASSSSARSYGSFW